MHDKLRRARVVPADVCSDAVFVRRVFLDLLEVLPTPAETTAFVDDPAPDKRARLVDTLLQRPEWALAQAMHLAELLQVDADTMEPKGAALLTAWLQQGFANGRPFDAMVKDLLTAEGATFTDAPANFWLAAAEPHLLGERIAQRVRRPEPQRNRSGLAGQQVEGMVLVTDASTVAAAAGGKRQLSPGYTVGILQQEPPLNDEKTVRQNVEEGLGEAGGSAGTGARVQDQAEGQVVHAGQ